MPCLYFGKSINMILQYNEKLKIAIEYYVFLQMLNQKIKRLEHLMTLKDVKIEDMNIQIHELKAGKYKTSPSQSPRHSPHHSPTAQRRLQAHSRRSQDRFLQPEWK